VKAARALNGPIESSDSDDRLGQGPAGKLTRGDGRVPSAARLAPVGWREADQFPFPVPPQIHSAHSLHQKTWGPPLRGRPSAALIHHQRLAKDRSRPYEMLSNRYLLFLFSGRRGKREPFRPSPVQLSSCALRRAVCRSCSSARRWCLESPRRRPEPADPPRLATSPLRPLVEPVGSVVAFAKLLGSTIPPTTNFPPKIKGTIMKRAHSPFREAHPPVVRAREKTTSSSAAGVRGPGPLPARGAAEPNE